MNPFASALSRSVVFGFATVGLLAGSLTLLMAAKTFRDRKVEESRKHNFEILAALSAHIRSKTGGVDSTFTEEFIRDLQGRVGSRITVLSPEGRIMAGSDETAASEENQRDLPEILEALSRGSGESIRFNPVLKEETLHLARAIYKGGRLVSIVRVSSPVTGHPFWSEINPNLVFGLLLALFLSIGVGLAVARRISGPLATVTRGIRALRAGHVTERVERLSHKEFHELGEEINRMADDFEDRSLRAAEEKEKLELALSALNGGALTLDREDRLVFWNDSAKRFLDWVEAPVVGKSLSELIRVPAILEMTEEVKSKRTLVSREVTLRTRSQERISMIHAMPCTLRGEEGVLIVIHDITPIRQLERVRQDFVVNASHELKTPLTAIKGYVDTLLDGADQDPETRRRFLSQLSANVGRLASLAGDLLDLAKMESESIDPQRMRIDCRSLVIETVDRFRVSAERKGLTMSAELPESPLEISTYPDLIRQVLDNLTDNAIKYTDPRGTIVLRASSSAEGVFLEVVDTGIGIAAKDVDRVFERFYRVDKTRSIEAGGTGLGLSIVKHAVTRLKGTIRVESQFGQGSRFTVELPHAA